MEDVRERPQMSDNAIDRVLEDIVRNLSVRLEQKGRGIFVSSHEIDGVLSEEVNEFKEAVRKNNLDEQREELIDVAIAAIIGIVSRNSGKMDW